MTTITDTMRTVSGDPDNSEIVFFVPEMRPAASGTSTVTMKRVPITPVNGAFSVTLDPGLVYAQIGSGRSPFVVPASGTARMGTLIAQYLPPTTTPTQVDAAITAWLEENPIEGGGLTVDQIATAATTSTPLKAALDNSYAPVGDYATPAEIPPAVEAYLIENPPAGGTTTVDGLTDATTVGKAVAKAEDAATARSVIGAPGARDAYAVLARDPEAMFVGAITRNANGVPTSAAVVWPDASPGTFTADTVSTTFPGNLDAWHVTYGNPVTRTYTQPIVTRNASGDLTAQPAIVVS